MVTNNYDFKHSALLCHQFIFSCLGLQYCSTRLGKTRISAIHIARGICGVKGRIDVAERTCYVCGFINCQWKKKIAQGCMFKKSPFVGHLEGRITSWLSKMILSCGVFFFVKQNIVFISACIFNTVLTFHFHQSHQEESALNSALLFSMVCHCCLQCCSFLTLTRLLN